MTFKLFMALMGAFTFSLCASAAVLDVDVNGILHGAHNVDVNGASYSVNFEDGSINSVYGNPSNFDATTPQLAAFFSQALLTQVFVDGASGAFDSRPALTYGCELGAGRGLNDWCYVWMPTVEGAGDYVMENSSLEILDSPASVGALHWPSQMDFSGPGDNGNRVWAKWTPEVPVPATAWLFGSGLLGLTSLARKRKAA